MIKGKYIRIQIYITGFCLLISGCTAQKQKTGTENKQEHERIITVFAGYSSNSDDEMLAQLVKEKLDITLQYEYRPIGSASASMIQTKLATGEMADLCVYNSGALLSDLKPEDYFVDLSNMEFELELEDNFRKAVTVNDKIYGVPYGYVNSFGGILYNKTVYEKYELEIPHTWDEFIANCEILKENGEIAVIGSFADKWSSQYPFLADYYNVQTQVPDFAEKYTHGLLSPFEKNNFLESWEKCQDLVPYYQENAVAVSDSEACDLLANGRGAHYISASKRSLSYIYSDNKDLLDEIGMFGIPGKDADDCGITIWPASGWYINKNTPNIELVYEFLEYYMSKECMDLFFNKAPLFGLPAVQENFHDEQLLPVVLDMNSYIKNGHYCIALEYYSTIKPSSCEDLTTAVALGEMNAKEAADSYERDCERQAFLQNILW